MCPRAWESQKRELLEECWEYYPNDFHDKTDTVRDTPRNESSFWIGKWHLGGMKMALSMLLANKESQSKKELQMEDHSQSTGVKSSVKDSEKDWNKWPRHFQMDEFFRVHNHIPSTSFPLDNEDEHSL